jgi:hypothetical protein
VLFCYGKCSYVFIRENVERGELGIEAIQKLNHLPRKPAARLRRGSLRENVIVRKHPIFRIKTTASKQTKKQQTTKKRRNKEKKKER